MRLISYTFFVFVSFLLLLSCEGEEDRSPNCTTVTCPPNSFLINIQDTDGNPLINSVFVGDSFKFYTPTTTLYVKTFQQQNDVLHIRYPEIETGTTYFLELDETEVDTLTVNFTVTEQTCCISYNLDSLRYNGVNAPINSQELIVLTRQ
ncbi:hypothetical protein POV27_05990 [Aureisphaera galaxeae]|uniref:hypothetical protein n=1 Tax=Aureisphaera galaxeae TaxID=1538023 RepID=UPI0023505244|nr:hypothetical protein [Aureisphaera galaxeae]MDC8003593.1 hypothetical protein [Aureisphaera galaxeae]